MTRRRKGDLVAEERAALVAWALAHGEGLTTAQVAEMTGLSASGALRLMHCLSQCIPVHAVKWVWCVEEEAHRQRPHGDAKKGWDRGSHPFCC